MHWQKAGIPRLESLVSTSEHKKTVVQMNNCKVRL